MATRTREEIDSRPSDNSDIAVSAEEEGHDSLMNKGEEERTGASFSVKIVFLAFVAGILLATFVSSVFAKASGNLLTSRNENNDIKRPSPQAIVIPKVVNKKHKDDDDYYADDDDDDEEESTDCDDGYYEKRTLKLAYERPMAALFSSYERKYETSAVIVVDGAGYAVCDSSWSIYKFGLDLEPRSISNVRLDNLGRLDNDDDDDDDDEEESDYEALSYHNGIFYVVRESIQHKGGTYHAIIEEIQIDLDTQDNLYDVQRQCSCEFEFEGDSKGFEGVLAVRDLNDELVLLGLCEGNHCSETYKRDRGNGRIIIMKHNTAAGDDGTDCIWKTIRTLDIPSSAHFADYSAMALNEDDFIAITSQEDSQLWVGRLLGREEESGLWDVDNLSFDQVGEVFDFPKDHDCTTIYCNIEGIHWLDDGTLLAASDKMKKKGKQDFRCRDKDQSVHIFALP